MMYLPPYVRRSLQEAVASSASLSVEPVKDVTGSEVPPRPGGRR
jgi:hypothetical protein